MAKKFITEQESRTLQRQMQNTNTQRGSAIPLLPETLPLLAKADADIAALTLGTFTLQANKPDGLSDSATTRDAYALHALKAEELVILQRLAGEASGGFWAARSAGTSQAALDCLCEIKTLVLENLTLEDEEIASLEENCDMCGIPLTDPCATCIGGFGPANGWLGVFPAGLTLKSPFDVDADYITMRDELLAGEQDGGWLVDIGSGCAWVITNHQLSNSFFLTIDFNYVVSTEFTFVRIDRGVGNLSNYDYTDTIAADSMECGEDQIRALAFDVGSDDDIFEPFSITLRPRP